MRKELKKINNVRKTFCGIFEKFSFKKGYKGPVETLLLKDVVSLPENQLVTDHLWFNKTKGFSLLDLQPGDKVGFIARVKPYIKGYQGYREDVFDKPVEKDYKLSHPTKIRKI